MILFIVLIINSGVNYKLIWDTNIVTKNLLNYFHYRVISSEIYVYFLIHKFLPSLKKDIEINWRAFPKKILLQNNVYIKFSATKMKLHVVEEK